VQEKSLDVPELQGITLSQALVWLCLFDAGARQFIWEEKASHRVCVSVSREMHFCKGRNTKNLEPAHSFHQV